MKRKYVSIKTSRNLIEDNIESFPPGNYTNLQYKTNNNKNFPINKIVYLAVDIYSSYSSPILIFSKSYSAKKLAFGIANQMKLYYIEKIDKIKFSDGDISIKYLDRLILNSQILINDYSEGTFFDIFEQVTNFIKNKSISLIIIEGYTFSNSELIEVHKLCMRAKTHILLV